ncbi:unannotated protein [freshwater metagenome]|uniref:Unannotated protein n=2 Tax=freshwater metagenome TaxID=449393 RepID=A0A6J6X768_9ZZZZ
MTPAPVGRVAVAVATMTDRRGRLIAAAAAGLLTVALGACGGGSQAAPTTTEPSVTSTSAAGAPVATQAPTAADADALGKALEQLGTSYHFTTTAEVNGVRVLSAEGDRVGTGARITLTSDAGLVSYVITEAGSWAKPENGDWAELDIPPASADPISALARPSVVAKVPNPVEGVEYAAVVSLADLGVAGTGTATLVVTLVDGRITKVTYTTTESGQVAQVSSALGVVKDPGAVVAPI